MIKVILKVLLTLVCSCLLVGAGVCSTFGVSFALSSEGRDPYILLWLAAGILTVLACGFIIYKLWVRKA